MRLTNRGCVVLGIGCLLASPASARAQTFIELGGGWNYPAPADAGHTYGRGYTIRTSLGLQLSRAFALRFDAFTSRFDDTTHFDFPPQSYVLERLKVTAITANGLVSIGPRRIFYAIGGAGLYGVSGHDGVPKNGITLGVSAGAGMSVPIGAGVRAFAEARYHVLLKTSIEPPWIVPVAFGVRFPLSRGT